MEFRQIEVASQSFSPESLEESSLTLLREKISKDCDPVAGVYFGDKKSLDAQWELFSFLDPRSPVFHLNPLEFLKQQNTLSIKKIVKDISSRSQVKHTELEL